MTVGAIVTRYGQALFDIGLEQGNYRALNDQLQRFAAAWRAVPELRLVLQTPSIRVEERKTLIRALASHLDVEGVAVNFLLLLADKDRITLAPDIADAFQKRADAQDGIVRADVTSAKALSKAQIERTRAVLGKLTGKDVAVTNHVDATLIGGVITRIDGKLYDGSLRSQLKRLREQAQSTLS